MEQRATFNQVLIPKKMVGEIPPFEFGFFSPSKKEYVTVRTAPVPLRVKEAANPPAPKPAGATVATSGEQSPAEVPKIAQPPVKLTDIVTVIPRQAAWITPRPPIWRDRTFLLWNAAATGAVLLLLGIKLASWLWHLRASSPADPVRDLWRKLRGASLTRGEFYQAAAQYIRQRGDPPGGDLTSLLAQHEQLNFGTATNRGRGGDSAG